MVTKKICCEKDVWMNWESWLFKEHPRKTVSFVIFLIGMGVGIYFSFKSLYLVILAYILLGGGTISYWLPTYYSLDDEGIRIKGIVLEKRKLWSEFRAYYKDKNGVFLSPFPKPTRLENYRGIYLRFNKNENQVMDFIAEQIEKK